MIALLLIGLFLLVRFDARLLREEDQERYQDVFNAIPEKWAFFASFLFIFAIPLYLYRRFKFVKGLEKSRTDLYRDPDVLRPVFTSDSSGIFISWFCIVLFFSIILNVVSDFSPLFNSQLAELVVVSLFSSVVMVVLIYRTTRKYPQGFLASVGLRNEHKPRSYFRMIFVPLLLGVSFAALSASIMAKRQTLPDTPLNEILMTTSSSAVILGFLATAVFLAPLFEEIMFRGYFFGVLRRYKGENLAIVVIAATFALLHVEQYWGDWLAIALVAFLGFSLTVLRVWSGTTMASIITHYTYNFCITIIPIFVLGFTNPAMFEYSMKYDQLDSHTKEALLKKSIETHPDHADAYNDLAWLYAQEKRNLNEAVVLIDKALENSPGNGPYLDTKAEILYEMGRFEDAIAIEEQLLESHPSNSIYRQQLNKFKKEFEEYSKEKAD